MSQVISFEDYRPSPRYDGDAWTAVVVQESTTTTLPVAEIEWSTIETIALNPVDADPTNPTARSVTTDQASDTDELWYRLVFTDASGDTLQPTFPVQNTAGREFYATIEELALLLRVNANTRRSSLRRVLAASAQEIDDELGRAAPFDTPPALIVEVNLERAVEHWSQSQSPFGVIGLGGEAPLIAGRDSWARHAFKLAPYKASWGLA